MWLYDINNDIYTNSPQKRRIFVVTNENPDVQICRRAPKEIYTIAEEYHDTQGLHRIHCDNYVFWTYQDALLFILELAVELNTSRQNKLMRGLESIATNVTKQATKKIKQVGKKEKQSFEEEQDPETTQTSFESGKKSVYLFYLDNGTVKIGISKNVLKRRQTISQSSGLNINIWYQTQPMPESQALDIESRCHEHFSSYRSKGEFFRISLREASKYLQEIVQTPLKYFKRKQQ